MQKHYHVWYRIAIACWLFIMSTIYCLNLAIYHVSTIDSIERTVVIVLVGAFSLYGINYYFDEF